MSTFEPWPDNMPLVDQVKALGAILMEHYPHTFDRSEGAMEKAARLLWEAAHDGVCDDPDCDLAALTHDHWTPEASITTLTSTEVEDHG